MNTHIRWGQYIKMQISKANLTFLKKLGILNMLF